MSVLCTWLKSSEHSLGLEHSGKHCALNFVGSEIVKWIEIPRFFFKILFKKTE